MLFLNNVASLWTFKAVDLYTQAQIKGMETASI